jgi:hypothetical protein
MCSCDRLSNSVCLPIDDENRRTLQISVKLTHILWHWQPLRICVELVIACVISFTPAST